MIDPSTLATSIQSQISSTVDQSIREYVGNIIRELSLDATWIKKIEQQINDSVAVRFGQQISLVDIDSMIAGSMDAALDRYWARQGHRPGVKDTAKTEQLTVNDARVTINNDLSVQHDASVGGTLTVQNLSVTGSIATDNRSWQELVDSLTEKTQRRLDQEWRQSLIDQVRQAIQTQGIDFDTVTIAGQPLLIEGQLSASVKHSSLQSVGMLDSLQVAGDVDISHGMAVRSRRVGINTQHPDMALSVWDEEVALVFGKHQEQTAYVGTLRPQRLVIGINRAAAIDITEQGRVTVNHLTVGRHRICHEPECPNYSGTKGDIVFNSNPKTDGVWGWQCLGAFKWVPLKSA